MFDQLPGHGMLGEEIFVVKSADIGVFPGANSSGSLETDSEDKTKINDTFLALTTCSIARVI